MTPLKNSPLPDCCRAAYRAMRDFEKELQRLSDGILLYLSALDNQLMGDYGVPTESGKRLAALSNKLDLMNDQVRYFKLGVDYRKDDKKKAVERLKKKTKVVP